VVKSQGQLSGLRGSGGMAVSDAVMGQRPHGGFRFRFSYGRDLQGAVVRCVRPSAYAFFALCRMTTKNGRVPSGRGRLTT
jgi:hypothetical protein